MPGLLPYSMYYENSRGEILQLDQLPCITTASTLFDITWKLTRSQRPLGEGGSLLARKRPGDQRTLTVRMAAGSAAELSEVIERMADIFDYDVVNYTAGRLWVNNSYLRCWCSGRVKEMSCSITTQAEATVTVCPEQPAWCTERAYRIIPGGTTADSEGHLYPYSYPYRYSSSRSSLSIYNSRFSASPMRITLYGPAADPRVYVGGVCIGVNTPLLSGERVVIDQQNKLITKIGTDGSSSNCFGDRIKNGQTFEFAPPGSTPVDVYSDTLGVDIVLIEQRSEPSWSCT